MHILRKFITGIALTLCSISAFATPWVVKTDTATQTGVGYMDYRLEVKNGSTTSITLNGIDGSISANTVCVSGICHSTWPVPTGVITGSGTVNHLPVFKSSATIGDSAYTETDINNLVSDVADVIVSTGVLRSDLDAEIINRQSGDYNLGVATGTLESTKANRAGDTFTGPISAPEVSTNEIKITSGSYYSSFISSAQASNIQYVLPTSTVNANGLYLKLNGAAGENRLVWDLPSASGQIYYLTPELSDISPYLVMQSTPTGTLPISTRTFTVNGDVLISTYATRSSFPNTTTIPAGVWDTHVWVAKVSGTQDVNLYAIFYKRDILGTETEIVRTSASLVSTVKEQYILTASTGTIYLDATDRLIVKFRAYSSGVGSLPTMEGYRDGGLYSSISLPSLRGDITRFVPYSGGVSNVDLGAYSLSSDNIITSTFQMTTGASDGLYLRSDSNGVASWSSINLSNYATLNGTQTFSGTNDFTGVLKYKGNDVTSAGAITNVAYLNRANDFQYGQVFRNGYLLLESNGVDSSTVTLTSNSNNNIAPFFKASKARGTLNTPLPVQANDVLGEFVATGYNGSSNTYNSGMEVWAENADARSVRFKVNNNYVMKLDQQKVRANWLMASDVDFTPVKRLEVSSNDARETSLRLTNSSTGRTSTDGFTIGVANPFTNVFFWNAENVDMIWANNSGAARMTFTAGGNLIVGTTTATAEKVFAEGNIKATKDVIAEYAVKGASATFTSKLGVGAEATYPVDFIIGPTTSANNYFRIKNTNGPSLFLGSHISLTDRISLMANAHVPSSAWTRPDTSRYGWVDTFVTGKSNTNSYKELNLIDASDNVYTYMQFRGDGRLGLLSAINTTYPIYLNAATAINGELTALSSLNVAGTSTLTSSATFKSDVSVAGDLTVPKVITSTISSSGENVYFDKTVLISTTGIQNSRTGNSLVLARNSQIQWNDEASSDHRLFAIGGTFRMSYNNVAKLDFGVSGTSVQLIGPTQGTAALGFAIGGVEKARISTDGYLGIGMTSPEEKLHVAGNIKSNYGVITSTFQMTTGAGDGKYLVSDSSGNATWIAVDIGTGDSVKAATETFTGAKTFESSATVKNITYSQSNQTITRAQYNLPVRQTVIHGRTSNDGYANFLEASGGKLVVNASTVSVKFAFSGGYDETTGEPIDYIAVVTGSSTTAISTGTGVFYYVDLDTTTLTLSYGSTTTAPTYSYTKTGVGNSFSIPDMSMYVDGVKKYRLFIGEGTTPVTYALRGEYQKKVTSTVSVGTDYIFSHNIGVDDELMIRAYLLGASWGRNFYAYPTSFYDSSARSFTATIQGGLERLSTNVTFGSLFALTIGGSTYSSSTVSGMTIYIKRGW